MAEVNVFEWVIKQVGADKLLKCVWKTANWATAWNAYEKRIKEDYGKVFVLGKADPVPLENIYTAVNVLEKPSALRRYSPEQLHERYCYGKHFQRFLEPSLLASCFSFCQGVR
jgi:hypothetical protein